jgi:hypothetical protein
MTPADYLYEETIRLYLLRSKGSIKEREFFGYLKNAYRKAKEMEENEK